MGHMEQVLRALKETVWDELTTEHGRISLAAVMLAFSAAIACSVTDAVADIVRGIANAAPGSPVSPVAFIVAGAITVADLVLVVAYPKRGLP